MFPLIRAPNRYAFEHDVQECCACKAKSQHSESLLFQASANWSSILQQSMSHEPSFSPKLAQACPRFSSCCSIADFAVTSFAPARLNIYRRTVVAPDRERIDEIRQQTSDKVWTLGSTIHIVCWHAMSKEILQIIRVENPSSFCFYRGTAIMLPRSLAFLLIYSQSSLSLAPSFLACSTNKAMFVHVVYQTSTSNALPSAVVRCSWALATRSCLLASLKRESKNFFISGRFE